MNKNWIYSDRVWYDFSDVIIRIYKITEKKAEKEPNSKIAEKITFSYQKMYIYR